MAPLALSAAGCISAEPPTRILSPRGGWTMALGEPLDPDAPALGSPSDDAAATVTEAVATTSLEVSSTRVVSASSARCPAEMALVAEQVCVDRWEDSVVEKVPGAGERSWPPYMPVDGHEDGLRAVSRPGVIPQGYVSGVQAARMCRASGKRLCGPGEWNTACRGPERTIFPYGPTRRAHVCNDDSRAVHPVAEVGLLVGLDPAQWWREGMNNPLINQLVGGLLPTGQREECTNEYGVFDMVGNLHEWVDDPEGTFRGGYYLDTTLNGDGCSYQTTAHSFDYHDYSTGFRCCMDADGVE